MLLFGLLLVPMVLATQRELNINNYVVRIKDNTLKSIEATKKSTNELDLSNLNLRYINKHVFDNLSNVKILNLSKNSLHRIPRHSFVNLTNLNHLDLANNRISSLKNVFVGLNNLKSVNVSMNNLENLERGSFFGLPKSCQIFVERYKLTTISTEVFDNPCFDSDLSESSSEEQSNDDDEVLQPLDEGLRVKVCIQNNIVKSLEPKKKDEDLTADCHGVLIDHRKNNLLLSTNGITGFERGWYRLQDYPFNEIDLSGNAIAQVTSEMLNDLPAGLKKVTLRWNEIKRLSKGIIENEYLSTLDLGNNYIREIEDGAFEKTNLTGSLYLDHNGLGSTKFAATLPPNLKKLSLKRNIITEIPADSFSKLGKLSSLKLNVNRITTIQRHSLRGLSGKNLESLDLSSNFIKKLENGALYELKKSGLRSVRVAHNPLEIIRGGLFDNV